MDNNILVQNLCKQFEGFSLDNVSFKVPKGRIVGFIGENGAGKSTTINLILNELNKDSGQIQVFGIDHTIPTVKENIGVVFDECNFHDVFTAADIEKILKGVYKTWDSNLFSQYLKKFKIPTKKTISAFSKGMKMKLAIAVALSHHAKLLILDEPTSGLDPFMRDEILDILYEFTREEDQSVLISSHIVSDLERLCDYIAYIDQGSLKLYEEKDCLIEQYGILKCSKEELKEFDEQAVKGVRENPYGVEALVDRSKMPKDYETDMATLEEIIVFLSKGQEE